MRTSPGKPLEWLNKIMVEATDECVLWPFARLAAGYGTVNVGGRTVLVHRHVCQIAHGPAPQDHVAAHRCGRRGCINPRHLRWATNSENESDKIKHGTRRVGAAVHNSKFRDLDIPVIRLAFASGTVSAQDLAARFGVNRSAIYKIVKGETWRAAL